MLANLLAIAVAILKFLGVLKAPADPKADVVTIANAGARISAETGAQTQQATEKELADAQAQTDASLAAVHDADGLRGVADQVNDAVARANAAGGV